MLLVNGGDINGSKVIDEINILKPLFKEVLLTNRANKYPKNVPNILTDIAKIKLFSKAFKV